MVDMNKKKSDLGIEIVMGYLKKNGYECHDVTKLGKEHTGYDVLAKKGNEKVRIEVKCSERLSGIPDCFYTEFDENLKFNADYMYIVRIDENHNLIKIQILSKEEFNRYSELHRKKVTIIVSNKLKNDLKKGKIGKEIL